MQGQGFMCLYFPASLRAALLLAAAGYSSLAPWLRKFGGGFWERQRPFVSISP